MMLWHGDFEKNSVIWIDGVLQRFTVGQADHTNQNDGSILLSVLAALNTTRMNKIQQVYRSIDISCPKS